MISVTKSRLASWQAHKAQWQHCELCPLCERRNNVCLVRGSIPADVLFVGEGPGESEDVLGQPFSGPAGELLDEFINVAVFRTSSGSQQLDACFGNKIQGSVKFAFSNILGCLPWDPVESTVRAPNKAEAKSCQPRLLQIIDLVEPRLIILLGQKTKQFFPDLAKVYKRLAKVKSSQVSKKVSSKSGSKSALSLEQIARVSVAQVVREPPKIAYMMHPSAILRSAGVKYDLEYKRSILTLTRLLEELK